MAVLEAYEVEQVGVRCFKRRCKVKEILNSLLTIDDATYMQLQAVPCKAESENRVSHRLVHGELDVNRAIHGVVQDAVACSGELKLLAQPDYSLLMESLTIIGNQAENTKVTQVICMESDSGPDGCSNLDIVCRILRYGIAICHYEPWYFYGKISEHFGNMNIFSYLIITEHYALQITSDRKTAILHDSPDFVACFEEIFDRIRRQSQPLIDSMDGFLGQQAQWGLQYAKTSDFSHTMEVCSGLCSIQFWDEKLIRGYMNPDLPGYETVIQNYTAYTQALYQAKKQGQITVFMNAAFVEEFIKDGIFREYPDIFFSRPVSQADRKKLIDRILKAAEEGWYHVYMLPQEKFPLNYRWEVVVQRGSSLLFQYSYDNQFRIFRFLEADIIDAVYDFLEYLSADPDILDEERSAGLLREWAERYLEHS